MIGEYQNVVVPVVCEHGGNIDKFMGDGILASFGAVSASSTYAADALRCIAAILTAVACLGPTTCYARPARAWNRHRVAHGPLVFGMIGWKSAWNTP